MAFAALGAAEVLTLRSDHAGARDLLKAAVPVLSGVRPDETWPWPEPRLTYANARWAEALLAAGWGLDDDHLVDDGLRLLDWLLDLETKGDRLSLTPTGGWGPGEPRPGFDQQPIEAAALADACARAYLMTGGERFVAGVSRAVGWFLGANDTQIPMYDRQTGGGYDGLERDGRNDNQGAESTIALDLHPAAGHPPDRQPTLTGSPRPASSRGSPLRMAPDPRRVVARLFLPGQEMMGNGESRAAGVIKRILALSDEDVAQALDEVLTGFSGRHRQFRSTLEEHSDVVAHRLPRGASPSPERRLLMGAFFTAEYAVEAAAICNPSMVLAPDQEGVAPGQARFVMSLRAIGEGHVSCIEFRTGVVGADGGVQLDDPGNILVPGRSTPPLYERELFRGEGGRVGPQR